jgi:hypothetical protein
MKIELIVFRNVGIYKPDAGELTLKKIYYIQNKAKIWNQEYIHNVFKMYKF